jgi:ParB/RepB/Spo0J family partition protein
MDQLILNFERIEGIKTEYAILSLDEISSEQELSERGLVSKPSRSFVDSLRQFGQIDPILVQEKRDETGSVWYQVWSGSRRVRALRQLSEYGEHNPTIKAQVIKEDWNVPYDVLMMVLNAARDSNEIADYFAIRRLLQENPDMNLSGISKALNNNLSYTEIRKRLSLAKIPEPLLNGVTSGMLTLNTARTITKLPKKVQIDLSDKVQGALNRIKETETANFADPSRKQEAIKEILKEGRIATKSIKQAKIENAAQVASLKLGGLLQEPVSKQDKSSTRNEMTFYVVALSNAVSFPTKKEADLHRQKLTAETGEQYLITQG